MSCTVVPLAYGFCTPTLIVHGPMGLDHSIKAPLNALPHSGPTSDHLPLITLLSSSYNNNLDVRHHSDDSGDDNDDSHSTSPEQDRNPEEDKTDHLLITRLLARAVAASMRDIFLTSRSITLQQNSHQFPTFTSLIRITSPSNHF